MRILWLFFLRAHVPRSKKAHEGTTEALLFIDCYQLQKQSDQ